MTLLVPDLVAPAIAGFGTVAVVLLLLGAYQPVLVIPLGLSAASAAAVLAARSARLDPGPLGPSLAALSIAAVFAFACGAWSGQYLDSDLDPGTYANAGLWLTKHPSLSVDPRTGVFGTAVGSLRSEAPGWSLVHGHLQAQGAHLLPALLAVGGWIGGPALLLKTNAAFGAAALLALFAFGRRFLSGWWAVLPVAVAAVSLPFLGFSRATYTEPVTAALVLGGLALFVPAVRHQSRRGLAVAAFVVGAACLARIDSYLYVTGVSIAGLAAAMLRPSRRWSVFAACAAGWSIPAALGIADLALLARIYFRDLRTEVVDEVAIALVLFILSMIALGAAKSPLVERILASEHRRRVGVIAASALLVVAAALASRPIWFVQRGHETTAFGALQALLGLHRDITRTYGEYTLNWLAWYFGWPAVVSGFVGLALLTRRVLSRPRLELAGPLTAVLVASVYLLRPAISPFQVWAIRRFVPLVVPGVLVGGAIALSAIYEHAPALAGRFRSGRVAVTRSIRVVVITLATLAVIIPAVVTRPLFEVRDHTPGLAQARALCRAVGPRSAVLFLDGASTVNGPTLRDLCGSVSAQRVGRATPAFLARAVAATSGEGYALYVIAADPEEIPYRIDRPVAPTTAYRFTAWEEEIVRAPYRTKRWRPGYWVARIGTDGLAEAVRGSR